MSKAVNFTPKRAVVAAVQLTGVSDLEFAASLTELRELAVRAGMPQATIGRLWPARMLLIWNKP